MMRTEGTFKQIYRAATGYMQNGKDDAPSDPVVRKEGNTWMIESRLEPSICDVEVSLDDFIDFWYSQMTYGDDYTPSIDDEWEFTDIYSTHEEE